MGIFYAWFLAPKIKYCLVTVDFGVILAKRTFKGFSEEHGMIKLEKFISLSEGKTVSGRFLIDLTKTSEGLKIPPRKQDSSDCDNRKICSGFVTKIKMNCYNCEMETACRTCLDLISQNKTSSTDNNMLKGNLQMSIIKFFFILRANMNLGKILLILNLLENI